MGTITHMPGISSERVETPRLTINVLTSGDAGGEPVLFIHGNVSSATYWEEVMLALPEGYRGIAPDLRGYGETEFKPVDATRGVGDFVDDMLALVDTMGLERFHVVAHSLGGSVVWGLIPEAGERILSVTLAAPGSPYGYGGTRGVDGTPIWPDYAGSGGGLVNPEFVRLLSEGDRTSDNPAASPRLSSMHAIRTGSDHYPGDSTPSENWPGAGPGTTGPNNALSPKYVGDSVQRLIDAPYKPPILWIWGRDDQIVSDQSLFDIGTLGKLGAVPGWPGEEVYPPQPMVSQVRAVLDAYKANSGSYRELALDDTGHSPYLERPEEFNREFHAHLKEVGQ
jgi:pimeloyl-ACP methyl ester carboxylesterase